MATQLPSPRLVFFDANGNPLAGGIVHAYIPATTTNKQTWQDQAGLIPNTQPIVLDSAGSALIYGSGSYQFTVTDSLGNAIPGYSGLSYDTGSSSYSNNTDPTQGLALIGYLSNRTGAVGRTAAQALDDRWIDARDFGANGTGGDDTVALNKAFAAGVTYGKSVFLPAGAYGVTDVSGSPGQYCLLNTGASIIGEGRNTSVIFPLSSTSSSADIMLLRPGAGNTDFLGLERFMIWPNRSGTAYGKRAIYCDFTGTGISLSVMHMADVYLANGNDYSLYINNNATNNPQGVPANSVFERCYFAEGATMVSIGDSVTTRNCVMRSTAGSGRTGVYALIVTSAGSGTASHFIIEKCNMDCAGAAIWIFNGRNIKIRDNNIESSFGTGSSASAVIDIDGTSGAVVMPEIKSNAVGIFGTSSAVNGIRVNAAWEADIDNNTIIATAATTGILLTSNAQNSYVGLNEIQSTFTNAVLNAGVGTRGIRIALSLVNSFANVGSGNAPASYWQARDGSVTLEGLLSCPATPAGLSLAVLPLAARPPTARSFATYALVSSNVAPQGITISASGVVVYVGSNSATQTSLDGITFPTNTGITGGL